MNKKKIFLRITVGIALILLIIVIMIIVTKYTGNSAKNLIQTQENTDEEEFRAY